MANTFPTIARYTPAVRDMACRAFNLTPEQYREGVLKRCQVEIQNLIESKGFEPETAAEWEEIFGDLLRNIRCALGDE